MRFISTVTKRRPFQTPNDLVHPLSNVLGSLVTYDSRLHLPQPKDRQRSTLVPLYRRLLKATRRFWDPMASQILISHFQAYARKARKSNPNPHKRRIKRFRNLLKTFACRIERANDGDHQAIWQTLRYAYSQTGPLRHRRLHYLQDNEIRPSKIPKSLPSNSPVRLPYISSLLSAVFEINMENAKIRHLPSVIFDGLIEKNKDRPYHINLSCKRAYDELLPRIAVPLLPHEYHHLHSLLLDVTLRNPQISRPPFAPLNPRKGFCRILQRSLITFLSAVCYLPYNPHPTSKPVVSWDSLSDIQLRLNVGKVLKKSVKKR